MKLTTNLDEYLLLLIRNLRKHMYHTLRAEMILVDDFGMKKIVGGLQ